ncbi:unnamed protein product [Parascedosporium putredinis]|uniref:Uncharacterized protein n=1 Tax=Parascedosporium putredinis TaxID=1442378 RepID=A0A9P1H6A2_9PEZI|nr:unnamed protein product [Parascedosporium putredinis]CAI7997835.1 unnamed protein product [Parascedosporium putredinis]
MGPGQEYQSRAAVTDWGDMAALGPNLGGIEPFEEQLSAGAVPLGLRRTLDPVTLNDVIALGPVLSGFTGDHDNPNSYAALDTYPYNPNNPLYATTSMIPDIPRTVFTEATSISGRTHQSPYATSDCARSRTGEPFLSLNPSYSHSDAFGPVSDIGYQPLLSPQDRSVMQQGAPSSGPYKLPVRPGTSEAPCLRPSPEEPCEGCKKVAAGNKWSTFCHPFDFSDLIKHGSICHLNGGEISLPAVVDIPGLCSILRYCQNVSIRFGDTSADVFRIDIDKSLQYLEGLADRASKYLVSEASSLTRFNLQSFLDSEKVEETGGGVKWQDCIHSPNGGENDLRRVELHGFDALQKAFQSISNEGCPIKAQRLPGQITNLLLALRRQYWSLERYQSRNDLEPVRLCLPPLELDRPSEGLNRITKKYKRPRCRQKSRTGTDYLFK